MIRLLKGFRYDNSYDYVKSYRNLKEQEDYFNTSYSSYLINNENYKKDHESFLIELNYDEMLMDGYNYVIFENAGKKIYAFITRKEYVNSKVTRINYEIDVWNTFLFDIEVMNSFIERKVCTIDEITDFDEGLSISEYVVETKEKVFDKESTYYAMFNGIREQKVIMDGTNIKEVVTLPAPSTEAFSIIDGIQYPLYFVPLDQKFTVHPNGSTPPNTTPPSYNFVDSHVTNTSNASNGVKVYMSATKLLGTPYIYGGNYPPLGTARGTDCSGLCQWAFHDAGLDKNVNISGRWTTYTMYGKGTRVNFSDARQGDIIYMNFNGNGKPEHVGIVKNLISASSVMVIHDPQPGSSVRVESWSLTNNRKEIWRFV